MPEQIADGWSVSARISLANKKQPDFLAISKERMLVLMSATRKEKIDRNRHRYVIRDAWYSIIGN